MELRDYLIDQKDKDWPELLSEWMPALPEKFTIWLVNCLGDVFFVLEDGSVHMLDIGSGEVARLANSREEFGEKIGQGDNAENWLLISLVDQCVAAGMRLGPEECYGFKVPPVLGGKYEPSNLEPTDLAIHYSLLGQIHEQTKDLPAGAQIAGIKIDDE